MQKLILLIFVFLAFTSFGQQQPPDNLNGTELRTWLKANWYTSKFQNQGYNGARRAMYGTIDVESDGRVYCVYTGFNQNSSVTTFLNPINAEHSIPQSWFESDEPMKSDIFHLYPTHGNVNSARGNRPFNENVDSTTDKWYIGSANGISTVSTIPTDNIDDYSENRSDAFEPREDHKGDVARAVFYFFTMYDISNYNGKTFNSSILGGNTDILYQWHTEDPVDDWEAQRNNRIEDAQGNRNPFVDYPDLACRAWGFECSDGTSPALNIVSDLKTFEPTDVGANSTSQSYTISAENLGNEIVINASESFEISQNDVDFSSSITVQSSAGTIANKKIYVRFSPIVNANDTITGELEHVWERASKTINLSGIEKSAAILPGINIEENFSNFGNVKFGERSQSQSYLVSGGTLTETISILASEDFKVSLDDITFSSSVTLPKSGDKIPQTVVHVRFIPTSDKNASCNGTLTHATAGFEDVVISISGIEFEERTPIVSFQIPKDSINEYTTYSTFVLADEEVNQPVTISLVLANASNITYGTNGFTTIPPIENGLIKLTLQEFDDTAEVQFVFNQDLDASEEFQIDFSLISGSSYEVGGNDKFILKNTKSSILNLYSPNFSVYPNPAKSIIYLPKNISPNKILFFDLSGSQVRTQYIENNHSILIPDIKNGIYFLSVFDGLNHFRQKIIINK